MITKFKIGNIVRRLHVGGFYEIIKIEERENLSTILHLKMLCSKNLTMRGPKHIRGYDTNFAYVDDTTIDKDVEILKSKIRVLHKIKKINKDRDYHE